MEYKEKLADMARKRVGEIRQAGLCADDEIAIVFIFDRFHDILLNVFGDLPPHTQDFFMMKFRALYVMSVSAGRKIKDEDDRQEMVNLEAGKILDCLGEDLDKSSLTRSEKSVVMGSIYTLLSWICQIANGMPSNLQVLFLKLIQAQLGDMIELHSLDPRTMN